LQAGRQRSIVYHALILLGSLMSGVFLIVLLLGILLLGVVLPPLVAAAKASNQPAHRGASSSSFTGISRDCSTDSPEGSTSSSAS
jgi:hypothetical protein